MAVRTDTFIDWNGLNFVGGHYYLYGMFDPTNADAFRYLGITKNPKRRYQGHRHNNYGSRHVQGTCECCPHRDADPFTDWWVSLRDSGVNPQMSVLHDLGNDKDLAEQIERAVIQRFLQQGVELFNRRERRMKSTGDAQ